MSSKNPEDLSATLVRSREGDPQAAAVLLPQVYAHLRRVAGSYFRGQSGAHTLQPTALVHEAFLRLCQQPVGFVDRVHFISVAATAMRQILIDHARRSGTKKRAGGMSRVALDGVQLASPQTASVIDVLALDEALTRLAALSPRQARIIELQLYGGLNVEEVAQALDVSKSLVEKDLRQARAWIGRTLADSTDTNT